MLISLDHALLAVRDLGAAAERTAALLGRAASWRGVHPGAGSANALFRLDDTYLELLAPAGKGALGDAITRALEERGEGLVGLAFGTPDADACAAQWRGKGLPVGGPFEGEGRDADSGAVRRWRNVLLDPEATRGPWLFAIEHRSGADALPLRPPAAAPNTVVTGLDHVVVLSADLSASRSLYEEALGLRLALDRCFEARGVRILFFRVGGVTVEVVGRLEADPGRAAAGDRFGGLAWRVADVDAARGRLAAAGFEVSEARSGAKPGTRVCTVRSGTLGVPTLFIGPEA
jgi:catechol 2,3-dioxygenase-like lactoylglutathione lyase family enzyme